MKSTEKTSLLQQIISVNRNSVYLGLIILFGAALRFYDLGRESFWIDEIFTINLIPQDLPTLIGQLVTEGRITRNAFYFLLAHFWVMPFGITEFSIRSLSVLFGILAIGMMYLVGKQLFGVRIGLISSFLLAVSGFQIQHSQAARFYSLFVLLTLLSIYVYLRALKTNKPWVWFINSLINILLFYTHSYAIFIFIAEFMHYVIYWKNRKTTLVQWGMSQLLLILAIIPSFISTFQEGKLAAGIGNSLAFITPPSMKDLLRTIYGYQFPQNYQHSWLYIVSTFAVALVFFVGAAIILNFRKGLGNEAAIILRWLYKKRFLWRVSNEYILVILWFAFPILLPFAYSLISTPIFADRYTICAAPAFYLIAAIAISRLRRIVPVSISLIAVLIVVVPGLVDYYASDVNEQWREAAAYVQENVKSNDLVVYAPDEEGYQHKSFDWYYHGSIPGCGISSKSRDSDAIAAALANCTLGRERFWVVIRGTSEVVNRMNSFFTGPLLSTYSLVKERQLVQISVYLFELKK